MNKANSVCVTMAPNMAVGLGIVKALKERFELTDRLVMIDASLKVWVDCGTNVKEDRKGYVMQLMLFVNGFVRGLIFATEQAAQVERDRTAQLRGQTNA